MKHEINKILKNNKRGIRSEKGEREVQQGKGLGELCKNRVMWSQDSFTTNRVREWAIIMQAEKKS